MIKRIGCKDCIFTNCDGCNLKTLEEMLDSGRFDILVGDDYTLDPHMEVAPVMHGRWVLKERAHYFKCSLCNEPIPYKFGYSESRRYYNYCPHCGAKMDGGKNND